MNYQGIINYPGPKQEYKVLVRCFTYNQKTYIEDALNGFAMQQTDFPFVCFVMDDASTDGEQDVIKAWMERECDMDKAETIEIPSSIVIIVPHKANISCTFAFYFLIQNLYKDHAEKIKHVTPWRERCEYEAICEGDDYWVDPMKLQKQADFLDNNLDYSMCFHAHKELYSNGDHEIIRRYDNDICDTPKNDMICGGGGFMATNSMFYRISVYNPYPEWASNAPIGDYPLMLVLLYRGKVCFMADIMSIYRIAANGSWSNTMTADRRRLLSHKSKIFQMLNSFNRWSNYEYRSTVHKMLLLNLKDRMKIFVKIFLRIR